MASADLEKIVDELLDQNTYPPPTNQNNDNENDTVDNEIETKSNEKQNDEYGYKITDETPIFNKNDRSTLENIIYEYFMTNDLLSLEKKMNHSLLQKLAPNLKEKDFYSFIQNEKSTQSVLKSLGQIPHNPQTWIYAYQECKKNYQWTERLKLWEIIQHRTVHLITNIYKFPSSIRGSLERCIVYDDKKQPNAVLNKTPPYINEMQIATINCDCIVAGIKLKKAGYNPVVLNLANQDAPAAATHRRSEGGTQEENLLKRSTYYMSLWPHRDPNRGHSPIYDYDAVFEQHVDNVDLDDVKQEKNNSTKVEGFYPMHSKFGGIYSKNVYVFRGSEKSGYAMLPLHQRCILSFIAVAAQFHFGGSYTSDCIPLSEREVIAYQNKARMIYKIALENGHDALVLGALGCGIFGNPPEEVAKIFYEILVKEFDGQFSRVMFAILWDHNSRPQLVQSFMKYFPKNDKIFE